LRRRHIRHLQAEPERHTLLFVAAGAIAGAAAGLYLGRRYRSVDAFLDDVRSRLDDVRLAWQEEGEDLLAAATQRVDEVVDDVIDDDDVDDEGEGGWVEEYDDLGARFEAEDESDDEIEDEFDDDDLDDELDETVLANGAEPAASAARAQLEDDVLEALHDDRRLRTRPIEIAVVGDGVVELTGSVHNIDEISRAAAVVRKVPGVAMVLNRIEVRVAGQADTASVPREPARPDGGEAGPTPA
jgi:hypothetical protein